jgi:GntR family transcriptional regulator
MRKKNPNNSPARLTKDESLSLGSVSLARRSGTSLKHQIYLVLRDQIVSGVYAANAPLPSEEKLSEEFRVSRITVRAALSELEGSGLVDRQHGRGTFVTGHTGPVPIHAPMADLLKHIADVHRSTQVELREIGVVKAPLHVQRLFECDSNELFQRAVRIRTNNGMPVFHVTTLVPQKIARVFTRKELSTKSLYQLLRAKGYQFKSGHQVVSAILAEPSVAAMLNVEVGAPLMQIRRIHCDASKQPYEYMECLASPAHLQIQMTLGLNDYPT